MAVEIKLFPPDDELPYHPDASQKDFEAHPNFSQQWLLVRMLAQLAGMASSGSVVTGPNADNAASTGNPVFVGAIAIDPAAQPSYTVGDRAALHTDLHGNILVNTPDLTATDDTVTAIMGASTATAAATLAQINKTVTSSGTPEAISATTNKVESILIKAMKGRATANTGTIYIGFTATNDSQLHALAPGEEMTLTAPDGKKIDTAGIYIDVATNGDGAICTTVN